MAVEGRGAEAGTRRADARFICGTQCRPFRSCALRRGPRQSPPPVRCQLDLRHPPPSPPTSRRSPAHVNSAAAAADMHPPPGIEEEPLSAEHYALLAAAVSHAEHGPVSLSATLATHPAHPLALRIRPRPGFPAPLHAALLPHALTAGPRTHALTFPPSAFDSAVSHCTAAGLPLALPPTLLPLARPANDAPPPADKAIRAVLGPLHARLLPFQRHAVSRAVRHLHGRLLLADDMGLGKTVQALAVAQYYRSRGAQCAPRPVLLVCPPTLRAAWADAVVRWVPGVQRAAVHVVRAAADMRRLMETRRLHNRDRWDAPAEIQFVVLAYDTLPKVLRIADAREGPLDARREVIVPEHIRFPIVVVDECHTLRNAAARRTQATMPFLLAAERCILISGTPLMSRPAELFPLLKALYTLPGRPFLTHEEFLHRYCHGEWRAVRAVNRHDELYALLSNVMVRRAKAEVQRALPEKVRRHVELQLAEESVEPLRGTLEELNRLKGDMVHVRGERLVDVRTRYNALCQTLFRKTAMLKIPGVVARVQQLLADPSRRRKVLVFGHHLAVLDAVAAWADREGVAYVGLDGRTKASKRSVLVDRFQTEPDVRLGVLSLAVAGTGLTLTAADVVLFAELSWVPSVLVQAEDRAHRIGRVGTVTVEYAVALGTADDLMWQAVRAKLAIVNKAVDGSQKKRKGALDVSVQSGKRVCVSELDAGAVLLDAVSAMEAGPKLQDIQEW